MQLWYIEGYLDAGNTLKTHSLSGFPLVLGRDAQLNCVIQGTSISRRHALIDQLNGELTLKDLDSRNGTYVNRVRIECPTPLRHGDVIHLGEIEIRLIDQNYNQHEEQESNSEETCFISTDQLSEHFPSGIHDLVKLIEQAQITPVFQPIITANNLQRRGFELLGRGNNPQLPTSPLALFRLAESYSLEVTLSELMRNIGVASAVKHALPGEILVNTHPKEMEDMDRLLASLRTLRQQYPNQTLSLEIHEQAITDIDALKHLKVELSKLNMQFAFDDFGVGQSRLLELVEAKPNIIKFDRVIVDGIHLAEASRINLVQHLLALCHELSIITLAECVSNKEDYLCCEKLGFELYQGFYFSYPLTIEEFKANK